MATNRYDWAGQVRWCKPNTLDDKFKDYQTQFYPYPETWTSVNLSGARATPKSDDHGTFIKLRRKHKQKIKDEEKVFGPVRVTHNGRPFVEKVPDGADVVVTVEVYDSMAGKGCRWESLDIRSLDNVAKSPIGFQEEVPF